MVASIDTRVAVQLVFITILFVALSFSIHAIADCPLGMYEYNVSGQYVCIPTVSNATLPYATIQVIYVSDGANITISCLEQAGCNVALSVLNATGGSKIYATSITLAPGEVATIRIPNVQETPLIINATVNGIQLPLFATTPVQAAVPGIIDKMRAHPILYIFYMILAFAPYIGALLRGSAKEAAIIIFATTPVAPSIALALGVDPALVATVTAITIGVAALLYFIGD